MRLSFPPTLHLLFCLFKLGLALQCWCLCIFLIFISIVTSEFSPVWISSPWFSFFIVFLPHFCFLFTAWLGLYDGISNQKVRPFCILSWVSGFVYGAFRFFKPKGSTFLYFIMSLLFCIRSFSIFLEWFVVMYHFDFNWLMFLLYFLIKLLPIVLGRAAYLFQQELLDFMQICLDTRQNSFCFGRTLKTSKSFLLHFHRWAVR